MRTFLDIKAIAEHVMNMKAFADKFLIIENSNEPKIPQLASLMDTWGYVDADVYLKSDEDVMENQMLYIFHMGHGIGGYEVVLKTGETYAPFPVFKTWNDLTKENVRRELIRLALSEPSDVKLRLINWSPINDPQLMFNMVFSFMDKIKLVEILGIKIDLIEVDCKDVADLIDYYVLLLEDVELES